MHEMAICQGLMNQAYNMGLGNIGQATQSGLGMQDYNQRLIDARMNQFYEQQNQPWRDAQDRLALIQMGAIGAPQTTGMSGWEGALQGAQAGLGLWNAFNQGGSSPTTPYVPAPTSGPGSNAWGGYFVDPSQY